MSTHLGGPDPDERAGDRRVFALVIVGAFLPLLLLLLFLGALGAPGGISGRDTNATELGRARWETRALRMEAELASRGGAYLVLSLPANVLTLKFQGAVLREFPLLDASVRTRRLTGWLGRHSSALDSIWGEGALLPTIHIERMVILSDSVVPPDPSGTVAFIPPSPEEAIPTPPSFRILFQGNLSLAVELDEADDTGDGAGAESPFPGKGIGHWFRLRPWRSDVLRLQLTMTRTQAGALYRSYSSGIPLMVVGPRPTAVPGSQEEPAP